MQNLKIVFSKLLLLSFILAMMTSSVGAVTNQDEPSPVLGQGLSAANEFVPGNVMVNFKSGVTFHTVERIRQLNGATYNQNLYGSTVQLWSVPIGKELDIAHRLSNDPNVEYAELNYIAHELSTIPDDPYFTNQWAYTVTNATQAWDISVGTAITIAIVDSGIDETHPDFAGKLTAGWDFVNDDSNPHDERGHGTHVAGIAAAVTNNSIGVAGMNWNARIMPIQVIGSTGTGNNADIASGINYACNNGAKIINLSVGSTTSNSAVEDAVNNAHAAGCLVVTGIGNCRKYDATYCPVANPTFYPAGFGDNVMAVAATGHLDNYTYYSQYGSHVDIAAPGGDMTISHPEYGIYSTMPTYGVTLNDPPYNYSQNYAYVQGSSMSVPFVSGLAGLIWSVAPTLTITNVQTIIETTAVDKGAPGWDPDYGHGRINALSALQRAANYSHLYLPLATKDYTAGNGWTSTILEDFESDFPSSWTVTQTIPGSGEYFWSKETRDCETYRGHYSGWAIGGGTDGSALDCGSNYPDNINSEMVYGPFSLADISEAYFTFQVWLDLDSGEMFRYKVSKDGSTFTGWGIISSTNGWAEYSIDFSDIIKDGGSKNFIGEANVWIQFRLTSDGSGNTIDGAFIDDITLHTCSTGC